MEHKNTGVVITGGDFQGLGVLRTFGEKDIPVVLVDNERCIARYSRYKKTFCKSPDPSQEEAYAEFLVTLAKSKGLHGWVLFANNDLIVRVMSKYRDVLKEYYRVPVPGWDVIKYVHIKEETYRFAQKHGIPVPRTYYAGSLEEMLGHDLPYPVIIKPSIRDNFYSKVRIKAFLVKDKDALVSTYRIVSSVISPSEILVQEFIPGGPRNLYSFCPFFKEGKVIAAVTARRARQHPMDFGQATTYAELVHIAEPARIAEKFLSLIGYYGLAEVEFMMDPRDGSYKLIEVNPRVWGWHALAIYAGVDLPYLLYKDMLGEHVEPPQTLRNVKWVRLITDVPTVVVEVVKGRMRVGEYIETMKGLKRDAVLSLRDPLPFIAELLMAPYLWYKRGF